MEDQIVEQEVENTQLEEPKQEVVSAEEKQRRLQLEIAYRQELKMVAATILGGISSNTGRVVNGKNQADVVKESVEKAMLLMNYVNSIPLTFSNI